MKCSRRVTLCLVFTLIGFHGSQSGWAIEADAVAGAMRSITTDEVKDYVGALADDTFEGRESGSRGGRAAATFIIQKLKKFGYHGAGPKDSFYQNFRSYHNILTMVEGRDPKLKDEVVVVGAHYHHVGYGSARNSFGPIGQIHNGADDNASGVAALLEIAEAISQLPERPRRTILIAFWDGEEKGLLGSEHWATNPTVPLDRVRIMVNADMVGRMRSKLEVFGSRTSRGLRQLVSRQNDIAQLAIDFSWQMKADSDHHTFFSRNIPIVMVHTGMHNDYHRPSDDADKINAEGLKQIAQLMFGVVVDLADREELAGFRGKSKSESRADQERQEVALGPLPGRLGLNWNVATERTTGEIVVSGITAGSAAERAGLRRGDRIRRFDGRDVRGGAAFRLAVLAAHSPVTAALERSGEPEPLEVTLNLPGQPARLGLSWRTDDAEPGVLIVNRVTPGSPADLAGLKVNDRIAAVNGQPFADANQFLKLVAAIDDTLALEVERLGRVRDVEIPPIDEQIASLSAASATKPRDDAP